MLNFKHKTAIFAAIVFFFIIAFTFLFATTFDNRELVRVNIINQNRPPDSVYILGTDPGGRDMIPLLIVGARNSFLIAFIVTIISTVVGAVVGIVSGFYGGMVDNIIMRVLDFLGMLPNIMIIIVLIALIPNYTPVTFSLIMAALSWPSTARLVRLKTLQQSAMDYVWASQTMGTSSFLIMFREILPNVRSTIVVFSTLSLANNMGLETALTFLGFGLPAATPSLGTLISHAAIFDALAGRPWQWLPAALLIFVMMLCINSIGQALNERA